MKKLIWACAVAIVICGCGRDESVAGGGKPPVPRSKRPYEALSTNEVVVVINGNALTKGSIENEIVIQTELAKIANPHVKVSELERMQRSMRQTAEKRFLERQVMVSEAKRRGFEVSDEDRRKIRERFAKSLLRGSRARYGILVGKLSAAQRAELDSGLDLDVLCQKANMALREDTHKAVSRAEAQRKFNELKAYDVRAVQEEKQIWKSATNAWERIQGGKDFETVAAACAKANEHVNYDMDWGEFDLEFFKGDTELCKYLSVMPVGSVTPPVPGDNGILIVKKLENVPVNFSSKDLKPRYRLAKIFFALPAVYGLTTVDALQADMEKTLSENAFRAQVNKLLSQAKVEYPNGKVMTVSQQGQKYMLNRRQGNTSPKKGTNK